MVRSLCYWSAKWRKSKLKILNLFIPYIAQTDWYII
jgi:hypothetical protein